MAAAKGPKLPEPVYGTVADGDTPTTPVGVVTTANLTDDGPDAPSDKPVTFANPLGDSKITVSSDVAHFFEDAGYKKAK